MTNKHVGMFLFILIVSSGLYGTMLANPVDASPYRKLSLSGEYSHDVRTIKYNTKSDIQNESNRLFVKFSFAPLAIPLIETYFLIGGADVNIPSRPGYSAYNGSYELGFGLGFKTYLTGANLDDYGQYSLDFYSDVRVLTTKSRGEADFAASMSNAKYTWNEYQIGFYTVFNYVDWTVFRPYLGFNWFYIDGTRNAKIYRYVDGEPEYFTSEREFFNDPEQWPKPVLGFDIRLKKGIVLSFETVFWMKEGTCLSVGISQLPGFDNENNSMSK